MASGSTSYPSSKETTNFGRVCRVVVDVVADVLRNVLEKRIPEHQFRNNLRTDQYYYTVARNCLTLHNKHCYILEGVHPSQ